MTFEWDEAKRQANLAKHGIDFVIARRLFDGRPLVTVRSTWVGEERFISIGQLAGRWVTVVWTWRHGARRLISVRRPRDEEKQHYRALHGSRA